MVKEKEQDTEAIPENTFGQQLRDFFVRHPLPRVRGHSTTGHWVKEDPASKVKYYNPLPEVTTDINKTLFDSLVRQWTTETMFMSSLSEQFRHPAYQSIVAMGYKAVPFLLIEMQERPNHWGHALSAITGANPVATDDEGRLDCVVSAWLDWGHEQQYPHIPFDRDLTIAKAIDIYTNTPYTDSHDQEKTTNEEDNDKSS